MSSAIQYTNLKRIYFIGIGGIGMSALARYFHFNNVVVTGYDRTETALTKQLQQEGIAIHFTDDIALADLNADLIIYTPAIPKEHKEYNYFWQMDIQLENVHKCWVNYLQASLQLQLRVHMENYGEFHDCMDIKTQWL